MRNSTMLVASIIALAIFSIFAILVNSASAECPCKAKTNEDLFALATETPDATSNADTLKASKPDIHIESEKLAKESPNPQTPESMPVGALGKPAESAQSSQSPLSSSSTSSSVTNIRSTGDSRIDAVVAGLDPESDIYKKRISKIRLILTASENVVKAVADNNPAEAEIWRQSLRETVALLFDFGIDPTPFLPELERAGVSISPTGNRPVLQAIPQSPTPAEPAQVAITTPAPAPEEPPTKPDCPTCPSRKDIDLQKEAEKAKLIDIETDTPDTAPRERPTEPMATYNCPCNSTSSVTVYTGDVIYDNGGPSANYSNGCSSGSSYIVLNTSSGNTIRVSGTLDSESGYDYLTIYNGIGTGGTTLYGPTAGTGISVGPVTSSTNSLTIRFYSDGSVTYAGFALTVTIISAEMTVPYSGNNSYTVCSGNLYDHAGSAGNYGNSANGYTVLYPSISGNSIRVSGTTSGETCCDYIYIYNGVGISGTLLWSGVASSGTIPQQTSTDASGALTIRFTSDGSVVGAGFNLSISCVAVSLPGDNCSNAQNLASLTSPYYATTIGYTDDISVCHTGSPDRIFYISVPNGNTIDIWEGTREYDEWEYMGWGGSCPGSNTINCWDNDAHAHNTWTNGTGSTQTVWYIQDGYGSGSSGNFTLNWTLTAPCTTPGTPTSLSGYGTGETTAYIYWSAGSPAGTATVYYVWNLYTSGGSYVTSGSTTNTFASPSGLSCGTSYYFTVYAYSTCNYVNSGTATSGTFSTSACPAPGCGNTSLGTISPSNCYMQTASYSSGTIPYWTFSGTAGTTYNFTLGTNTEDSYLHIYNSSLTEVAYNDDNGPFYSGTPSSISYTCTSTGTHYVTACHYTCTAFSNSGSMVYWSTSSPYGNSSLVNLSPSTSWQYQPYSSGYMYFYGFSATSGNIYDFSLCDNSEDSYIRIYDSGYIEVFTNDDSGPWCSGLPSSCSWTAPSTGTYYIQVSHLSCIGFSNAGNLAYKYQSPCTTPGTPTGLGASLGTTDGTFYWSAGSPAGSPTVSYYYTIYNSSWSVVANGSTTSTSVYTSALACGTGYYLYVYAHTSCNGTTSSTASGGLYYTGACCTTPSNPTTSGTAAICSGSSTNISATSTNATTIYWYTGGCGVTSVGTSSPGANFSVSPSSTTTYYARGYNSAGGGCWSSGCGSATITVNPTPSAPTSVTASPSTICEGSSSTLTAEGSVSSGPIKALIVYADGSDQGLNTYLTADSRFGSGNVTSWLATSSIPSVGDMLPYNVVITWGNNGYANSATFGDNLKSYVDAGGGVVVCTFGHYNEGSFGISGGFLSNNYDPIQQTASYVSGSTTIGTISAPSHPIMAGVSSASPGYYFQTSTLTSSASAIFYWANGYLGCAVKEIGSGRTVGLNQWPGGDGGSHPDLLIANAAAWAGKYSASGTATISWFTTSTGGTAFATGGTAVVSPTSTTTYYAEAQSSSTPSGYLNGAGGTFTYNLGDPPQTIALKACESHYGVGNCAIGVCGYFTYYYRTGALSCNCSKPIGEYEWIYSNTGYTTVGQDYGGDYTDVTGDGLFVRVKGSNACDGNSWNLALRDLGTATGSGGGTPTTETFSYTGGVQTWTVPSSGIYTIEAWGAEGGQHYDGTAGGKGARMRGSFNLTTGQVIKVAVGQMGGQGTGSTNTGGGGGGGTFVWIDGASAEPLIAAGGGGGGWTYVNSSTHGQVGTSGGVGDPGGSGGTAGYGGSPGGTWCDGAGGAGWKGDGNDCDCVDGYRGGGKTKFTFTGGDWVYTGYGANGGFGGGGGTCHGGGGGGGYSGGGGGANSSGEGGGGGSYNSGTDQDNTPGVRSGNGQVAITYTAAGSGGCVSPTRTAVTVTLNTNSSAPSGVSGTTPICQGQSTTLSVSGGSLGTGATWRWYSGGCGGTSVGSGSSIGVSPTSSTTYYVRAEGTCNNTACAGATVTVNAPSTSGLSNGDYVWTGITSTDWATASNWLAFNGTSLNAAGSAPTSSNNVFIRAATSPCATNTPTVSGTVYCKNLTIESGKTLNSGTGTINVYGNWINSGTFNHGNGTVTFSGTVGQTIGGTSPTTFYNVNVTNSHVDGVTILSTPGVAYWSNEINLPGTLSGGLKVGTGTGYWQDATP